MQLLIVHDDAEVGEQLMSMVQDYTAHHCDVVESDAAALRWAREHARCGLLLAQLEGPAIDGLTLGGSLSEIFPGLQTLFFPAYPAAEQQLEIAKTKVFPEPIDGERLLEAIETMAEPGPDAPDLFHVLDVLQMCCLSGRRGAVPPGHFDAPQHHSFFSTQMRYSSRPMKFLVQLGLFLFLAAAAQAQIQVELKFKRLQYVAHEPVMATVKITNLAGRDIDLHDEKSQHWFGFEVNAGEGRLLAPLSQNSPEPALHVEAGKTVTRKVNLTPAFPVHDFGAYHVRANVYFADLNKFFYSQTKVFQVADARPIWQKTVGIPDGMPGAGEVRTYSLLSNRFPDHTSLYVRVENRNSGVVYTTYSLGRVIAYDEPQTELDRTNQLHVLHCAAPRSWAYSHIGWNGELLAHSTFMETKTRPRLRHAADGAIAVSGGRLDLPVVQSGRSPAPKLSAQPPNVPRDD